MTSGRCVHMLHKLATLPISVGCGDVVVWGTLLRHMDEPALERGYWARRYVCGNYYELFALFNEV